MLVDRNGDITATSDPVRQVLEWFKRGRSPIRTPCEPLGMPVGHTTLLSHLERSVRARSCGRDQ